MTVEQLALDLFGTEALCEEQVAHYEVERTAFVTRHQIGQIRLPWDTAGGDKAGDLIPAWRCCHCGAIELNEYLLGLGHDCCRTWNEPSCYYVPREPNGLYRMDAHWIPPHHPHRTTGVTP